MKHHRICSAALAAAMVLSLTACQSGGAESGARRKDLQKRLGLPERLSANGLLAALNGLYSREEALALLYRWSGDGGGEALEKQAYLP